MKGKAVVFAMEDADDIYNSLVEMCDEVATSAECARETGFSLDADELENMAQELSRIVGLLQCANHQE